MLNSGLQSCNKIIIKIIATPYVDLTARGVACFFVRSCLLSPQKNGIIKIANILTRVFRPINDICPRTKHAPTLTTSCHPMITHAALTVYKSSKISAFAKI